MQNISVKVLLGIVILSVGASVFLAGCKSGDDAGPPVVSVPMSTNGPKPVTATTPGGPSQQNSTP